ncbi:MAG: cbb3-type cytochrome c oxidase subunit 3 [Gammaproteobacteria bacterium]
MDFGTIHSIYTVLVLIVFVGIVLWAYDDRSKARFEEAARIPLEDDDDVPAAKLNLPNTNAREKNNA